MAQITAAGEHASFKLFVHTAQMACSLLMNQDIDSTLTAVLLVVLTSLCLADRLFG